MGLIGVATRGGVVLPTKGAGVGLPDWSIVVTDWGLRLSLAGTVSLPAAVSKTPAAAPAAEQDSGRPYDIIIYGATGFTGRLMVEHLDALLSKRGATPHRWAIAGRSVDKLRAVAKKCRSSPDVIQASTREEISAMAGQCRVLVAAAGPYQKVGEAVVRACVEQSTHYVDVTGEAVWIHDMIERYHNEARRKGVMVVNCAAQVCSVDEINCYLLARKLGPLKQFREYFFQYGGTTGGTFSTSIATMEGMNAERFQVHSDPFCLGGHRRAGVRDEDQDCRTAEPDKLFPSIWQQPAYNGHTGSRVIRRTCQLFEERAGDGVAYGEALTVTIRDGAMNQRSAEQGVKAAGPLPSADVGVVVAGMMKGQLDRGEVPRPGEGPPPETRAKYFSDVYAVAEGENGQWAHVHYVGPEAYEVTAMCCVTAALVLVEEADKVNPQERGGIVTPAFALHGSTWIQRLQALAFANGSGRKMSFEEAEGKPSEESVKKALLDKTKNATMGQAEIMQGTLKGWGQPALA